MKTSHFRFRHSQRPAFTLVELLVVMGIITILAAVIINVSISAVKAAKRARASNMATQIQTAVLGYYTEYNVYPVASGATTATSFIGDTSTAPYPANWGTLINVLSGNIKPYDGTAYTGGGAYTNSRAVAFLSLRSSDVDNNNAPLNPLPTGTEIYFNIVMDADYAGVIGVAPSTYTTLPKFTGIATVTAGTVNTGVATSGGTTTSGVAIWANCNGTTSITNAASYVHTY